MNNRIYRFRAWDNELKLLYFPDEIVINNGEFIQVDGVIWLEYTGLKDKNGKEIYEGDILHSNADIEVYWNEHRKQWWGRPIDTRPDIELHKIAPDYVEIIGNIYENSNLLKEI